MNHKIGILKTKKQQQNYYSMLDSNYNLIKRYLRNISVIF